MIRKSDKYLLLFLLMIVLSLKLKAESLKQLDPPSENDNFYKALSFMPSAFRLNPFL